MAFDAHKNLASALVVTPPSPSTSGTSLTVTAGTGVLFPTPPFNCTVCPASTFPTTTNAEIVRVTNISTDTFTITRTQEGTSAMPIAAGYFIGNTITVKVITDIENAITTGGVTSIIAGTGISVDQATGDVTVTATGSGTGNVTAAGTLTNNALVIGQGTTAVATTTTGTGILTALGVNTGSAGAPVLVNGVLGTPSSGNGSNLSGVVLSITGTTNQVVASASTGAVTLSLPQDIATSSTPRFATIGLGAAASGKYGVYVGGIIPSSGGDAAGFNFAALLQASANSALLIGAELTVSVDKNGKTGLTAYGLLVGADSGNVIGSGTIPTAYGINISNITMGATNNYALFTGAGLVSLGDATDSSSSTTGAVIIAGGVGIAKKLFVGTNITAGGTLSVTGHVTLEGVTSTGATGTGKLVFDTSPTLVTPALGTAGSGNLGSCTVDGTNLLGFRGVPQNSQSAAYTTVLADAGKEIYHPVGDANARTFTLDSNANVAYVIGTVIVFTNMSANNVTISITSDTLFWFGTGGTGSRTLAQYGTAAARKLTSTSWGISGTNLT